MSQRTFDFSVPVVVKVKIKVHDNGCWESNIRQGKRGYSSVLGQGGHRIFYENFVDDIPDGFHVDHQCGTTWCVNPNHLLAVLPAVNILRSNNPCARNARKTKCPRGHRYSKKNTVAYERKGRKVRYCNKCIIDRRKERLDRPEHCQVPGCAKPLLARGMCNAHYTCWYRAGKPDGDPILHFAPRAAGKVAAHV